MSLSYFWPESGVGFLDTYREEFTRILTQNPRTDVRSSRTLPVLRSQERDLTATLLLPFSQGEGAGG